MKKEKGITLIALIITILVIIILAAVTIRVVAKVEIIDMAKQAATETAKAQIKEKAETIKYTVLMDAKTCSNNAFSVVEEYKDRLKQEFGEKNLNIVGNKVTIYDKYEIIIKNTDLEIEVGFKGNNNDLIIGITTTKEHSEVDENGKIHAIMMNLKLSANMTSEEYVKNITIEERKKIILKEMGEQYKQEFENLYDLMCYEFGVESMEAYIYENEGIENVTLGQIYYYYAEGTCEGEYTEEELIDILNSWDIGYAGTEYNRKTKNLKAVIVVNGKESILGTNYSVESKPVVEFLIHENGVYDFKILDYTGEIVADDKVIVNCIAENEKGDYVPADGTWITDGNGKLKEYKGNDVVVRVPKYVGTEKITIMDNNEQYVKKSVFIEVRETIKKITIPNSVTTIGECAITGCKALEEVIIPNSVKEIGQWAFRGCTSLKEIVIPNSVERLELTTFSDCTSLTKVVIPDSVTSFGSQIFEGCTALKEIELPDSIATFGYGVFKDCTSLEKVKLPNAITELPLGVFLNCSSLKEVEIPDTVTSISEAYFGTEGTFEGCTSLSKIKLTKNLITIEQNSFKGCTGLTEIRIPKSVTSIAKDAFANCTNLKNIYIEEGSTLTIPETEPWGATKATVTMVAAE